MMTVSFERRRLLLTGVGGMVVAALSGRPRAAAAIGRLPDDWIPSDALLNAIPTFMKVAALPGLAIAVVEGGVVAWTRSFGVANAETGVPINEDTVFELASLGKPVFAYVVLQLAEEGLIDVDRPLGEYFKPEYLPEHPWLDLVTTRDVLRHSSGLPNWRRHSSDELVPAFKPGTSWRYSGEGYFWLQLVVEQLTDMSLDELVAERLFDHAGLQHATYAWSDAYAEVSVYGHPDPGDGEGSLSIQASRERWNRAMRIANRWNRPIPSWRYRDAVRALPEVTRDAPGDLIRWPREIMANAASSLRATVSDYARFLTLLLSGRVRSSWEITEPRRLEMVSRQIARRPGAIYWGLGLEVEQRAGGLSFAHHGNNGDVFTSFMFGDPARRRAIVIATNGGGGPAVYQRIIRETTGEDLYQFLI